MLVLHLACWWNQLDVIKCLCTDVFDNYFDVPTAGSLNTPLHYAACKNNIDICKYLLEIGAQFSVRNSVIASQCFSQ